AGKQYDNQRGDIYASDGTLLAKSVRSSASAYHYARVYPQGSLYAHVVGYSSAYYGTAGIENEYNDALITHTLPAQTLSQTLGFAPLQSSRDSLTLTIDPTLQQTARTALSQIAGSNKDAAVFAENPRTGAVLADYSTPTFDPDALASPDVAAEKLAGSAYFNQKDFEGSLPGLPLATAAIFPPGSTFKVVTTAAVYNLAPQLSSFTFPEAASTPLPHSDKVLDNDGGTPCGGNIETMLPESCDPGYGLLGIALGAPTLAKQAEMFGYNATPPIDLPKAWVSTPFFPSVSSLTPPNQALLAYSAIGQLDDKASALSNALVAAGIANGGVIMQPYLVQQITDSQGALVATHHPKPWMTAATPQAAASVTALMKLVVTQGTADQVGFPASLDAAVKTGTAQTGNPSANTDDWMIGFAPADNPEIAVAVVVPNQNFVDTGAGVAGPIMKAMLEAGVTSASSAQPTS
ncbi:MAG TPA: penicillin-binding transpeptidase domain-containing protein, partial [Acidimicrobiales bacterium]|nr:penicillin-binding transpeptidase domain-containing protein [Acidimicrobiales bacterium]